MEITSVEEIAPLLFTILKHKALDWLKHEQVRMTAFETFADWQSRELSLRISSLEACSPDGIFSNEIGRIVRQTLYQLPEQTRQAFVLSRFKDKSNREIAEAFQGRGISHLESLENASHSVEGLPSLALLFLPAFALLTIGQERACNRLYFRNRQPSSSSSYKFQFSLDILKLLF